MIKKATLKDLDEIIGLYNKFKLDRNKLADTDYITGVQKKGFLLGLDDKSTFEKEISESYDFLVAEEEGKIVGYLIADHSEDQKFYDDEYKTWFGLSIKDFYYNNPKGMTIASIAVDPDYSGKGIATKLLKFLEQRLIKESYTMLFSIVTVAPLTNCPSIVWHSKNGFKRLAMGKPREKLFDLDWYSGILFYKPI